jgi:hypothetical protein
VYELPKTISVVKMLLAPEELGSTILFLLKKWISKASRLTVRSFAVLWLSNNDSKRSLQGLSVDGQSRR